MSAALLRLQTTLLESFLSPAWLTSPRNVRHVATRNWRLAQGLLQAGGHLPLDRAFLLQHLPDVARMLLDAMALSTVSGGGTFSLGQFANYGDDDVRRRIDSIKGNAVGFASLMTEFAYAAWHEMKGHKVTAYDADSFPDFRVNHPRLSLPIIADCKRIRKDTLARRYRKVIAKANKQVKTLGVDGHGIAVLDISEKTDKVVIDLQGDPNRLAVQEAKDCATGEMVDCNKSLSGVLLQWDECKIFGFEKMEEYGGVKIALIRYHEFLYHPNARFPLPREDLGLHPTFTLELNVRRRAYR